MIVVSGYDASLADFSRTESRPICRYLATKYKDQGTKLLPDSTDLKAVALFEQWASVEKDNWDVHAASIVAQKLFNTCVYLLSHDPMIR